MIAALCMLNKDDFESNIIMNRLIHLLYIEIHNKEEDEKKEGEEEEEDQEEEEED